MNKKLAYFDVTADLFLEVIKERSDLPKDTRVIRVETDPPWNGVFAPANIIRLYCQSDKFEPVMEGQPMPRREPTFRGDPKTLPRRATSRERLYKLIEMIRNV